MVNQIDKDNIFADFSFSEEGSSYAFVKKEVHSDDNFSTYIFSVYGSDGALLAAFDGIEVVFHQAALASVPRSIANPRETNLHCVNGTLNVLDAARNENISLQEWQDRKECAAMYRLMEPIAFALQPLSRQTPRCPQNLN